MLCLVALALSPERRAHLLDRHAFHVAEDERGPFERRQMPKGLAHPPGSGRFRPAERRHLAVGAVLAERPGLEIRRVVGDPRGGAARG